MIDYILEILEKNNRVIVPELGAFIVKQRKPFVVIFNEFLQYNDGMLVELIAKKENIDSNEAKIKLEHFTSEIKNALDHGEYYALDRLGDLVKTPSGKISLCEPNAVFGKSILYKDTDIAIEIEDTIQPELEEVSKTEEIISEKEPEVSKVEPPIVVKPAIANTIENIEPNIEKIEVEKVMEEPVTQVVNQDVKNELPGEVEIPRPYITTPEAMINKPSTTKSRTIIIWTILIILVNAAIAGFFLRNQITGLFKKNIEVIEPIAITDSLAIHDSVITAAIDSTVKEVITSQIETQINEPPVQQDLKGYRHYIVAGVFRNEANANKLITDLQKKGFKPEKFGKIGELYGVSYEAYNSKEDAEKALIKIKSETDPGAWLKTINY